MNIHLHGYGSFPVFCKALVELARDKYPKVQWAVILPNLHYVEIMTHLLGKDRVLYLQKDLSTLMQESPTDLDLVKSYPGSLWKDVESDQFKIKHRPTQWQ